MKATDLMSWLILPLWREGKSPYFEHEFIRKMPGSLIHRWTTSRKGLFPTSVLNFRSHGLFMLSRSSPVRKENPNKEDGMSTTTKDQIRTTTYN